MAWKRERISQRRTKEDVTDSRRAPVYAGARKELTWPEYEPEEAFETALVAAA